MILVVRCLSPTFRLLFGFPLCRKFGFLGVYSFAGTTGSLLAWVIKIRMFGLLYGRNLQSVVYNAFWLDLFLNLFLWALSQI